MLQHASYRHSESNELNTYCYDVVICVLSGIQGRLPAVHKLLPLN